MMPHDTMLDIIKGAILLERRGKSFYQTVAKQTTSKAVRDIFDMMAAEEAIHIEILQAQYDELLKKKSMTNMKLIDKPKSISVNILSEKIRQEISAAGFEAAAISAAISMEEKAVTYYEQCASESSDQTEKELYQWLSDWEKSHLKYLSDIDTELRESVWYDNNFWPLV